MESVRYSLDGARIESRQDFFDLVGEAVDGPGAYFGRNFDAFSDCLTGGYGTPPEGSFYFVLTDSDLARARLGYPATLEWLSDKLLNCHPTNVESVLQEIHLAESGNGPTVFDIIVEIFEERGVRLELL